MTRDEMKQLPPGSKIRRKRGKDEFIVTANHDTRLTAVQTVDVTNPDEWDVVQAGHNNPGLGAPRLPPKWRGA